MNTRVNKHTNILGNLHASEQRKHQKYCFTTW